MSEQGELPKGWAWTNLSAVADLLRGVSYRGTEARDAPTTGYRPILRANNIGNHLSFDELVYVPVSRISHEQYVRAGDIVLAMSSGSRHLVGKSAQARNAFDGAFGAFCGLIRVVPELESRYLAHYLQSPSYRAHVHAKGSGVNINNLRRDDIESLDVPLPPLAEQRRIVYKLEELFTRLDAGAAALERARAQLARYRQAVLRDAFAGKLTAAWREAHRGELEPASALLERIRQERDAAEAQGGRRSARREPPRLDTTALPALPDGWAYTCLGDIVEEIPKINPQDKPDKEFLYLDISSIDNTTNRIVAPKRYLGALAPSRARQLVKGGDILFSTVRTYLKNIALVSDVYDGQVASTGFCVLRPKAPIDSRFIFFLVQTDGFLNALSELQRGTSYPAVRDSDVLARQIPLPPLLEQRAIMAAIDEQMGVIAASEIEIERCLQASKRLRQSILRRAFEGRLVPQDPADEPAAKLLERIRAQRAPKGGNAP